MSLQNQEPNDYDIYPTVFTVPTNKPFILEGEAAKKFLKELEELKKRKKTKEDRAKIIEEAENLFKKPEKK